MAFIGIESLNEDNIVSIQKRHNLNLQFKELIKCFNKADIRAVCSVMFGLDYDSPKSIMETVDFMIDNKIKIMLPSLPGLELLGSISVPGTKGNKAAVTDHIKEHNTLTNTQDTCDNALF